MSWYDSELYFGRISPKAKLPESPPPFLVKYLHVLIVMLCIVVTMRIVWLAGKEHRFWSQLSQRNQVIETVLFPPRGVIFDRNGKPLATNEPSFDVVVDLVRLSQNPQEKERTVEFLKKLSVFAGSPEELLASYQTGTSLIIRNIPAEVAFQIRVQEGNYPSVRIINSFKRSYTSSGETISHVIGYIGLPTELSDEYHPSELIGKAGVERSYQEVLRGVLGKTVIERTAKGEHQRILKQIEPVSGRDLVLTFDARFQKRLYAVLSQYFAQRGFSRGAAIALDPRNGEVLALVSLPSYDNNAFVVRKDPEQLKKLFAHPHFPLFNRVISGLYSPGSVIKPILATAALEEQLVAPQRKIYSSGELRIPHPYIPGRFSVFKDWKAHGWVNMREAIANSVNVYFYTIGGGFGDVEGLGIWKMKEWYQRFGLGGKTGVDLPGEEGGFIADPETKKRKLLDPIWRLGDTYNMSIGQGDFLVTPLQIAVFTGGLATNRIMQPHLVKEIREGENDETRIEPRVVRDGIAASSTLKIVQEGMRMTVTEGTGVMLNDLPVSVAGKSGTVQVQGFQKLNAIFTGYAPYHNPEIVLTILIEDVPVGALSVLPVYREILQEYFEQYSL